MFLIQFTSSHINSGIPTFNAKLTGEKKERQPCYQARSTVEPTGHDPFGQDLRDAHTGSGIRTTDSYG